MPPRASLPLSRCDFISPSLDLTLKRAHLVPTPLQLQSTAIVLSRIDATERHWRYNLLTRDHGLIRALRRKPGQRPQRSAIPDIFDLGDLTVQQRGAGKPRMLEEFLLHRSFRELAHKPEALTAAAALSNLLLLTFDHAASTEEAFSLFVDFLDALTHRPRPEAAFFKAVYALARKEGFPVREEWAPLLGARERELAVEVLKQPLSEITTSPEQVTRLNEALLNYLERACDWRLL